jgi:hypothetical protein
VHPIHSMVRKAAVAAVVIMAAGSMSCRSSDTPDKAAARQQPAAPEVPADIQNAANADLGSDSEVLLHGDWGENGQTEALVVNRLKTTPQGVTPGVLLSRATIIERDNGTWKELFRCDGHLKNPNGYLGATPLAAVPSWRLQYEQHPGKGLEMFFTPLEKPAGGYVQTIEVRWNPQVKRYESLDRSFEHFLTEVPAIETPDRVVR